MCHNRYPVLNETIRLLDDLLVSPDLRAQISWELLPFLLITNPGPKSAELKIAVCVAETTVLSQHPLTQGWASGRYMHMHVYVCMYTYNMCIHTHTHTCSDSLIF